MPMSDSNIIVLADNLPKLSVLTIRNLNNVIYQVYFVEIIAV